MDKKKSNLVSTADDGDHQPNDHEPKETYPSGRGKQENINPPKATKEKDICIERRDEFGRV